MADSATGSPTPLGIPKLNTSVDDPNGRGINAMMDSIDTLITARITAPVSPVVNGPLYWNGSSWVSAKLGTSQLSPSAAIVGTQLAANTVAEAQITALTITDASISNTAAIKGNKTAGQHGISWRDNGAGSQNFAAADGTVTFTLNQNIAGTTMWAGGNPTRMTVPAGLGGTYLVTAYMALSGSFAGTYGCQIRKNGTTAVGGTSTASSASQQILPYSMVINLAAADYLELLWSHGTSTTITTQSMLSVGQSVSTPWANTVGNCFGFLAMSLLSA